MEATGGSKVDQQPCRVLDRFLHADKEGHRLAAVDQAMIVGKRKIHHRADHDLSVAHDRPVLDAVHAKHGRSEEHTSELQSLMRSSYAVFCLNNKTTTTH